MEWGLGTLRYFEILKRPASMDSLGKSTGVGCHALPRALPNPGIKPASLRSPALVGGFFTTSATWEAPLIYSHFSNFFSPTFTKIVDILGKFKVHTILKFS